MHTERCIRVKYFVSMKIVFNIANSAGPNEMLHHAASHQGLHCLSIYLFMNLYSRKCLNHPPTLSAVSILVPLLESIP